MARALGYVAASAIGLGALIGTVGTSAAYTGYDYAPPPTYYYSSHAHYGYGAYASSPRGYYREYGYNPWSPSRSLNHGQGPGCMQSPASIEYTGCDGN